MDFKTATDLLTHPVTQDDLAKVLGVTRNSISRARLDPQTDSYRTPPSGWRGGVARLARRRAAELTKLAADLREAAEGG